MGFVTTIIKRANTMALKQHFAKTTTLHRQHVPPQTNGISINYIEAKSSTGIDIEFEFQYHDIVTNRVSS